MLAGENPFIFEGIPTGGRTYKFRGSLCADFEVEGIDLSDLIRDAIGMDDLYVWLHHFTKIPS